MTKRKAPNGAGSIRKRSDGRWEGRYTAGYDGGSGKPIRRTVYGRTQKEVRQKLTDISRALDTGTYQEPSSLTVAEWLEEWLTVFCVNKVKPLTMTSYRGIVKNHINPRIGAVRLQDVRGTQIQRLYNDMLQNGLSPKTIKNVGAVLHKAFAVARKQGYIQVNPCDNAELPKVERKEIKPLTEADIPLFLHACSGSPMGNAYALCLLAGLREGECMGLAWEDIDFERGLITVRQQLQREQVTGGRYYIATTKSSKIRTVAPPPIAFDYLRLEWAKQAQNRLKYGDVWNNPWNLVFTNEIGEHYKVSTFYKRFKVIAEMIGRPDARPHDLRHTAVTVAIANGVDIKSVQSMLGHATASFTLDVYTHTSQKMMEANAAKVQGFYDKLKNQKSG